MDPQGFQEWYSGLAPRLGLDPNPDAPEHHYDYRGFYGAMRAGEYAPPDAPGGHWPSEFKTADHPRALMPAPNGRLYDTRTGAYLTGGNASQRDMDWGNDKPSIVERVNDTFGGGVSRMLGREVSAVTRPIRSKAMPDQPIPLDQYATSDQDARQPQPYRQSEPPAVFVDAVENGRARVTFGDRSAVVMADPRWKEGMQIPLRSLNPQFLRVFDLPDGQRPGQYAGLDAYEDARATSTDPSELSHMEGSMREDFQNPAMWEGGGGGGRQQMAPAEQSASPLDLAMSIRQAKDFMKTPRGQAMRDQIEPLIQRMQMGIGRR